MHGHFIRVVLNEFVDQVSEVGVCGTDQDSRPIAVPILICPHLQLERRERVRPYRGRTSYLKSIINPMRRWDRTSCLSIMYA